jgi:hypothetical protein
VDILHAGLRPELTTRAYADRYAAVTVFDNLINPFFNNITVLYSASDGMNFSNVGSSVKLRNSQLAYNRGRNNYFFFVESLLCFYRTWNCCNKSIWKCDIR